MLENGERERPGDDWGENKCDKVSVVCDYSEITGFAGGGGLIGGGCAKRYTNYATYKKTIDLCICNADDPKRDCKSKNFKESLSLENGLNLCMGRSFNIIITPSVKIEEGTFAKCHQSANRFCNDKCSRATTPPPEDVITCCT